VWSDGPVTLRSRPRGPVAALAVGAALALAACSASATPSTPISSPTPFAAAQMLTASDLGPGWAAVGPATASLPCSAPATAAAIVGPGGSVVRLAQPGGLPSVVEYVARPASPASAYVSAVERLQTSASCGTTTAAHATTSTFVGVLPLPTVGLRSVTMVFANTADGQASQTGYQLVRQGAYLVVVGTTNSGPLDVPALRHATAVALQELDG